MRILSLVHYKIFPALMGGQKGIALFYAYLSKNIEVNMVCTNNNETPNFNNINFLPILTSNKFKFANPLYFFSIKKIIKQLQITHLIIEHPFYGWLGILLKFFTPVKFIVHSHNIEALRFKSTGKWWWCILAVYEKLTHQKADYNFFIHNDDKNYAIKNFNLLPTACETITYGFLLNKCPTKIERQEAKQQLLTQFGINENTKLLLFNGTLNYEPNLNALQIILNTINPMLLCNDGFNYKIIICGNKLPEAFNRLADFATKNIIYAGFVDDINLYFKGCDVFLNPVIEGGGIKTKLVEALGNGMCVVTTTDGAIGVDEAICKNKLTICKNTDWSFFTTAVLNAADLPFTETPTAFYDHFYWGKIAEKANNCLLKL